MGHSISDTSDGITRRRFLWLTSMSAAGVLAGCATNPVTGESQLMLVSEGSEILMDRQNSPHQFSSDYGAVQDAALNSYIDATGKRIAAITHRPQMPYSFRVVNAAYVNAYAFPGGSIAATRGILLSLNNEAELAALMGHELGHVNARHTAHQMSKGMITSLVVSGISAYIGSKSEKYAEITSMLGMLGAGMLLASYSRDDERQADALGMEYMVKSGYSPRGMVGLMDMLQNLSKEKPGALEVMFSTHPMSEERYRTAVSMAQTQYAAAQNQQLYRERYMDHTAKLRSIKDAIEELQKGDKEMSKKQYAQAEAHFKTALSQAPSDYAALAMMSKCLMVQQKYNEAERYAEQAKSVYPNEAQAHHLSGFAKIQRRNFDKAYQDFSNYDRLLPGNPYTTFYKGMALEGMQRKSEAASQYQNFLQSVSQGDQAKYAYQRLTEWGYMQTPQQTPTQQQKEELAPKIQKKRRTM